MIKATERLKSLEIFTSYQISFELHKNLGPFFLQMDLTDFLKIEKIDSGEEVLIYSWEAFKIVSLKENVQMVASKKKPQWIQKCLIKTLSGSSQKEFQETIWIDFWETLLTNLTKIFK